MSTTTAREPLTHTDFETFVLERSTALLRTAWLLTHDRHQADDLLQAALTKAWFAWGRLHGDPEPYVRRTMFTTFVSGRRRRWGGEVPTAELPEVPGAPVEPGTDLWPAVCRLPVRQRAVVVLRFYEDLSVAETADVLGCSTGTVKSQLSKALAHLRLDPTLAEGDLR